MLAIDTEAMSGVTDAVALTCVSEIDFGNFHREIIQQLT